ncbi:L-seryl-tRNA(Sec) selenium transferase [Thermovirga lienii DSM 17291]|jgi:L-seryl-tRNA(Ser) seleniumtransferase|uniref:L-seryl-tRNA(Sec) selenium transferase n=1 Tax=Thermovirga lienii (strain ATCC BAA-1197 / DSM 17291 / Cas60314) TaxID=580340 RepID=G7V589_THELD|nr:L-seryl-tRNA(Sec) selenium transferase [Thermovirga lienii]AER66872.1 L-seryl-tRNA(Sec) selenium transferase [Thermovirga lienii DSM 17291]MDN5318109.1 L-seryl-tRNA(Ser) seleniumtransferase [Thermovirga sp.]MDN5367320.1 L-seryl-tRNA(Ser) seleniumtransferase [Thermovirga sp.]HCD71945.1 L-seryl-tRNA(Sec) selenium transferase [Thermovirga lienii]
MKPEINKLLREIPSMDELLARSWVAPYEEKLGRNTVKSVFADVIGEYRKEILKGTKKGINVPELEKEVIKRLERYKRNSLRRVINATGVVVHTNLGRSCLSEEVIKAVSEVARGYSNLEYDLEKGERGQRLDHVEWLLCQLTGADGAVVVNNNAGAVLLCLSALAQGGQAIISRGELVEIGGSFRIPEIMAQSGVEMVEVGTTNKTHIKDYREAITERTKMLLKVHPSNFRIIGFQSVPSREELAEVAKENDLVFMEDLGSGVLVDLSVCGLKGEPTVANCVRSNVDVVTFSGDKLLGGPQAGCIVGRKPLIDKIKRHPLHRALRIDKMTLAALEATLRIYLEGRAHEIPTIAMLCADADTLKKKALRLKRMLKRAAGDFFDIEVVEVEDVVGGGAYPADTLKGYALSIKSNKIKDSELVELLRKKKPPVIATTAGGFVLLHVRTILRNEEGLLIDCLKEVAHERS